MLEKKAGALLNSIISWQLYSNNLLIDESKNVQACYIKDKILEYFDKNAKNKIDIVNNKFIRFTNDYELTVDFNKKMCYFKLPNKEELSIQMDGEMTINNQKIVVIYNYDEEKKIVINIKE